MDLVMLCANLFEKVCIFLIYDQIIKSYLKIVKIQYKKGFYRQKYKLYIGSLEQIEIQKQYSAFQYRSSSKSHLKFLKMNQDIKLEPTEQFGSKEKSSVQPLNVDQIICSRHGQQYVYNCADENCKELICGDIKCIDSHFHNNHLSIHKIDKAEFTSTIKVIENFSQRCEALQSQLVELKSSINNMKEKNVNIFNNLRKLKLSSEYLRINEQPLNEKYLTEIQNVIRTGYQVDTELEQLSQLVRWNLAWISLNSELEVINKLKLSLQQFSDLEFQHPDFINENNFSQRWGLSLEICVNFEGIMTIFFIEQGLVVGQFIGNNQIETSKRFMKSFLFVVDKTGTLHQFLIKEDILHLEKETSEKSSKKELFLYFVKDDVTINKIYQQTEGEKCLQVNRIMSFICLSGTE